MAIFHSTPKLRLLTTAAPLGLIAMIAMPATAQTAPPTSVASDQTTDDQSQPDIVITGSLLRRADTATPSPVTVLTADSLDKRGITTISDAVQRLSANGAGTLPPNFSAAGAFANGASAASLRGLTTSSTLVLFDGLRAAYYPLADDGTRNFVDLNTIPDAIVDRFEVLRDGASSTYGADAVAGVINVITKKQIVGVFGRVEAGISQRGDTASQRIQLTAGFGDLKEQGFNFYVSGEYQHVDPLFSYQRGYPYNSSDLSSVCGTGRVSGVRTCRTNANQNAVQFDNAFTLGTTYVPMVRAYNATGTAAIATSRFQILNPGLGCYNLPTLTLTAAQLAANAQNPVTTCVEDARNIYNMIAPRDTSYGGSARFTANLGGSSQAYAEFNYYHNQVFSQAVPRALADATTAASNPPVTFTITNVILPIFICGRNGADATLVGGVPTAAGGCTAANGTLNPNNPFAAAGQTARLLYRPQTPVQSFATSNTFRGALGVSGTFGVDWAYNVDFVAMRTNLNYRTTRQLIAQHLLNVLADGSYNFVNPAANSAATESYLFNDVVGNFNSQLYQGQASISKALFELPGGPLQLGVGVSARRESVFAPSRNPENLAAPRNRYFGLNAFGAVGSRTVTSANFEIGAPIVDMFELNLSGRYDRYSTKQDNFSPKIGAKFTPIKQLSIRGTYSKGFRIGSFAETSGSPTTGFVLADAPAAFQAAHGNASTAAAGVGYSLGLTTISNPNLQPEKSTNLTAGIIFEPVSWLSVTVDYYNIRKKGGISFPNYKPTVAAYYALPAGTVTAGQTIAFPGGYTVTAGAADPAFPAANPVIGFLAHTLENSTQIKTSGLDFTAEARIPLGGGIKLYSSFDATYVLDYEKTNSDGTVERYDGSLGPYQITSASGTPKWRGSWLNTLDFGFGSLSATLNYTDSYLETAEDNGGRYNDQTCLSGIGTGTPALYRDNATPVVCRVKRFFSVDMSASIKVTDKFNFYVNVNNLFDVSAPYDATTYGGYGYNPAWASSGIIGRYFRAGVKASF
jgi:iron complex outermembrane receptor protein